MDIDDILASVDHDTTLAPSHSPFRDLQELTRFWVAERSAPEILPWPAELMARMMERVREQISAIEDLTTTSSLPPNSSYNPLYPQITSLHLPILQTDLSRTQFLLRALLRARLAKLATHALHYLTAAHYRLTHLSPPELAFLTRHQELLHGHYAGSFLGSFPAQLRRLDDEAGGIRMIEGPEGGRAVFVRCLGGKVRVGDGGDEGEGEGEGDGDEDEGEGGRVSGAVMRRGKVWVVRWERVRRAVERGDVELL